EGSLVTLGAAYEKRPRLAGGAYSPMLRRVDPLLEKPVTDALPRREALADKLLAVDDLVTQKVDALKARGMKSPYLRAFVVARVNPVRWASEIKISVDEALAECKAKLEKFNVEGVQEKDLAKVGGPPP